MHFMLLFSRQGKLRLQKWYVPHPDKTKKKITRELITTILARKPKMSSFLEWKDLKIVYKRYLSNLIYFAIPLLHFFQFYFFCNFVDLSLLYYFNLDYLLKNIENSGVPIIIYSKPSIIPLLQSLLMYHRFTGPNFFIHLIQSLLYRYASLYFCCAIDQTDNELLTLEVIHRYVELLDKYFGSVSHHSFHKLLPTQLRF